MITSLIKTITYILKESFDNMPPGGGIDAVHTYADIGPDMDKPPIADITTSMVDNAAGRAEPDGQQAGNRQFFIRFNPAPVRADGRLAGNQLVDLFQIIEVRRIIGNTDAVSPVYLLHQSIAVKAIHITAPVLEGHANQIPILNQCTYTPFWSIP